MSVKSKKKSCSLCGRKMIMRNWKIDFKRKKQFFQITNYPLFICPHCGEQQIHAKATRKVLSQMSLEHLTAIKLTTSNTYIRN